MRCCAAGTERRHHRQRSVKTTEGGPRAAGMPSFYAVRDRRYDWIWRCYSTNCAHSTGLLRHSFRLLQYLLELTASQAIREARAR